MIKTVVASEIAVRIQTDRLGLEKGKIVIAENRRRKKDINTDNAVCIETYEGIFHCGFVTFFDDLAVLEKKDGQIVRAFRNSEVHKIYQITGIVENGDIVPQAISRKIENL